MNCLSSLRIGSALVLGFCLGLAGCTPAPSEAPAAAPTPVTVSYPVEREVTDYADFTGRTAAVDSVEVRARVWGYLDKVNFKEGALVKKGDVLFEIDPRTYQAALDQAEGNLVAQDGGPAQAAATRTYARGTAAGAATGRSAGRSYDKIAGDRGGDRGHRSRPLQGGRGDGPSWTWSTRRSPRRSAAASAATSSPRATWSRRATRAAAPLLTTIVSVDPMYAYFDVDERTVLRVRQLIREGKAKSARDDRVARVAGPGQRGGVSPPGDDQFRGQPGQSEDRHPAGARRLPQQGRGALPRVLRPRPGAHRPAPSRRCWSPTAPSTTTRARRSSTSSTTRTRWSPAPSASGRCTTACG